ncbi:MAG: hypothetical protein ACO3A2_06040 [Bdellovibrionia bacterium]
MAPRAKAGEMENEQLKSAPNHPHLNQFISQLEAPVGASGRSLYQILSEYLSLKGSQPELAWDLEDLLIADAASIDLAQRKANQELLAQLQTLKKQAAMKPSDPSSSEGNPWRFLAHADHQPQDLDPLLRTIRFAQIQIHKFWIELQSCPLFFNSLNQSSVNQIEEILLWIQASPSWNEIASQSRLVPALVQPNSRKVLLEFMRDVRCAQVLKDQLKAQVENYEDRSLLAQAVALVQKHQCSGLEKRDLEKQIYSGNVKLAQVQGVFDFFKKLHAYGGFPKVSTFQEMKQVFKALKWIREIPQELRAWRRPLVLASGQAIRLQSWEERARPIRDMRKRLHAHFILGRISDSEKLRDLSEALISGGVFRKFKAGYKEAQRDYLDLLLDPVNPKGGAHETPLQKSERLIEWANYLDQLKAFGENSDLNAVFGSAFQGIDTPFDSALKANTWANHLRQDLQANPFGKALVDFICAAPEVDFQKVFEVACSAEAQEIESQMASLDLQNATLQSAISEWSAYEGLRLAELSALLSALEQLKLASGLPLSSLFELHQMSEEWGFLESRMEACSELKIWLKGFYQGSNTDISIIEQGLSYVRFVEEAPVPETIKISFLSLHGPQRFHESKVLVAGVISSLPALKEHLQKLEHATLNQVLPLERGPLVQLMIKLQEALKQPALLEGCVAYLKLEREARAQGLGGILDYFEAHVPASVPWDVAYQLALDASVLKSQMTGPLMDSLGGSLGESLRRSLGTSLGLSSAANH